MSEESRENTVDSGAGEPSRDAAPHSVTEVRREGAVAPRQRGAEPARRRPLPEPTAPTERRDRAGTDTDEGPSTAAVPAPQGGEVDARSADAAVESTAGRSDDDPSARPVEPSRTGRQRLREALWPPRVNRAQLTVALLLCVLGLGLAIQVRSTSEHSVLRGARQEDLVRILSELDDRTERLEEEKRSLEQQREELETSSDQAEEARRQTERTERQLGVLAGTVAAEGPGIVLTITDPHGTVKADMLLDALQELRAAGAEAIQVNRVRVVANTHFTDADGGVRIDGHRVSQPYRFKAIGDPEDLEPALNIPGGVVQSLQRERATVSVERAEEVTVDALRPAKRPDYARSPSR